MPRYNTPAVELLIRYPAIFHCRKSSWSAQFIAEQMGIKPVEG